jgi:hypothetical protein
MQLASHRGKSPMVEPVARAEERMISNDLFRLSLAAATKRMKRSGVYRHPLFACGELEDPVDTECPFIMQAPLPEIEREWCFSRASVPPWIKLFVGRAAREISLSRLEAEYNTLEPAERFRRVENLVKIERYSVTDPDTWDTGYFCAIVIPGGFSWFGNRSVALTHPEARRWFFDPRSKVSHGQEAVTLARDALGKVKGAK